MGRMASFCAPEAQVVWRLSTAAMGMRLRVRPLSVLVILLTLFKYSLNVRAMSTLEKPSITRCRSPDKETFTCWWEPGSDGGLLTNYTLWYSVEGDKLEHECTDYQTMGPNSCFFDRNHTSIWVIYTITVIATNQMGSSRSDPVFIDVTYIVQPEPPSNVSLQLRVAQEKSFILVQWSAPVMADTQSGWITLKYNLRLKPKALTKWEYFYAGHEAQFIFFSFQPDSVYMVQVRCKADHGIWSDWSSPEAIRTPHAPGLMELSVWSLVTIVSCVLGLTFIGAVIMKMVRVKSYLLPPVPGPKIKGFDIDLQKVSSMA
ncbi:prolactin receptor-like [Heterodontus francisci]|uniref:prolactin receptor-like n=1 Tax=Heterodontus francisci TaxID=7792 RepID=UPI00355C036A